MFICDMIPIKTHHLYVSPPSPAHPRLFSLCCSLKLECEKLATEKTEIQRHYVMVRQAQKILCNSTTAEIQVYTVFIFHTE